jgi:endo-1,4-beta-xylanase
MLSLLASAVLISSPLAATAEEETLRQAADRRHLNIGTCARADYLRDNVDGGRYALTLSNQFNLLEPENDLKPPAIWQGIGKYNFANPDFLTDWAATHKVKVRGHVLVYARDEGYTIPGWLRAMESQISSEQAKQILRDYIFTVVGRYKGKIAMWDVVNEAIDDNKNDRPFNLRNSFWFRKLGPEFLLLAFQYAHEADPKAELYYNEYNVEHGGSKADSLLALADYLREHHAPITGLGLQYHIGLWDHIQPGDGHYALLDQIRQRKLAFMITELDIGIDVVPFSRTDPNRGLQPKDASQVDGQANLYADVFKMALCYKNCHGVQMWGFTDRHSWIPDYQEGKGAALLFDGDYAPKAAEVSVLDVLKTR